MSMHKSYGKSVSGKASRSVMKRRERYVTLREKGLIGPDNKKVTNLPKTKPC